MPDREPDAAPRRIFVAPGRGETLADIEDAIPWAGRVTIHTVDFAPPFSVLPFAEQTTMFRELLEQGLWDRRDLLVGRSFGAWILLNALMELKRPYSGAVILISSVLGYGGQAGFDFMAPRARSFWSKVTSGVSPPARHTLLIHAVDDEQCPFRYAVELQEHWKIRLAELPQGGHGLGRAGHAGAVSGLMRDFWVFANR